MNVVLLVLKVLGGLCLFLFGMRIMSVAIQKRGGNRLKYALRVMTGNRFAGIFTGFVITGTAQSSSATTVLLVSFANAGLMSLEQCLGVVMGANIGTTVTGWLISLVGSRFSVGALAIPIIATGLPFYLSTKETYRDIAEILIGFGLLFVGLGIIKDAVPDVRQNPEVLQFLAEFTDIGVLSLLIFVLFGTIITLIVQSSSVAMAVTLTMAFRGWIPFPMAAAAILGENVGTTVTAIVASMTLNKDARRVAAGHVTFNLVGIVWALALFKPFISLVDYIVPATANLQASLPVRLAAFHSLFNILNSVLFVGFVNHWASLLRRIFRRLEPNSDNAKWRVPFLNFHLTEGVETMLTNILVEVGRMATHVYDMVLLTMNAAVKNEETIEAISPRIFRLEEQIDEMQENLSEVLKECTTESMNEEQAGRVGAFQRIVNELESIGDSAFSVVRLLERKVQKNLSFHKKGFVQLQDYIAIVLDFIKYNLDYLCTRLEEYDFDKALDMESLINTRRDKLRKISVQKIEKGADVRGELAYMDIIRHLEHIGDYCLNVSQAIREMESARRDYSRRMRRIGELGS